LVDSKETESSESENAKITGEKTLTAFFMLKVSFIMNCDGKTDCKQQIL
jgi:hypothetical protein